MHDELEPVALENDVILVTRRPCHLQRARVESRSPLEVLREQHSPDL